MTHYLVTGHTGFKGAWLVLLLRELGHRVSGFALDPKPGALYEIADVGSLVESDIRADIRDADAVRAAVFEMAPDVVIHLAAQPLVRESYRDPRTTFETNVTGTLNALEAVSATSSVLAHLVITTDKVYRNDHREQGYTEEDPLGAADPYSTSKAMADLLSQSWALTGRHTAPLGIARGGNVVGGGDNSAERLLPHLLESFVAGRPASLRYPDAVRPWQHVLDCLTGYLAIVDALLAGSGRGAWNIGPGRESFVTVGSVADRAAATWGDGASWARDTGDHPHEAGLLSLDASKAAQELDWVERLAYPASIDWTIEWHRAVVSGSTDPRTAAVRQIRQFLELKAG